jgi:hypothetical protein
MFGIFPIQLGENFLGFEVDLIALRMGTASENSVFPDSVPVLEVCSVTQYRCLLPSDDLLSDLQALIVRLRPVAAGALDDRRFGRLTVLT